MTRPPASAAGAGLPRNRAVGTCASTLFPTTRSAARPSADEPLGNLIAEEVDDGRDASRFGGGGDVAGGLDPEDRNSTALEELQQIAVVARDLDDLTRCVDPEALRDEST